MRSPLSRPSGVTRSFMRVMARSSSAPVYHARRSPQSALAKTLGPQRRRGAEASGLAALPGERQVPAAVADQYPLRRVFEIEIDLQAVVGFAAADRQVPLHLP